MKLHRAGHIDLIVATSVFLILNVGMVLLWLNFGYTGLLFGVTIPTTLILLILFNFFRVPVRKTPQDESKIFSPCDGKVVVIEEVEEKIFFKKKMIQLSIFMSPLNVHQNFNPISGKIVKQHYYKGKYLMAFNPKSSQLNESNLVVVQNDKITIGYKQIAGFLARRIISYVNEGEQVEQGGEYGFIKLGSRIDVFLPIGTKLLVNLDDKVTGSLSVIAEI